MRTLIQSRVIHIDRSYFSPDCSNQVTWGISDIDDEISLMHAIGITRFNSAILWPIICAMP